MSSAKSRKTAKGTTKPQPSSFRVSVNLTPENHAFIHDVAATRTSAEAAKCSLARVINEMVTEFRNGHKKKPEVVAARTA